MNATQSAPRILITRLSHIGDCVLTLPLVCAIKRALPDAFIAWVMESPTHQLLEDHPCIDEIIRVPKGWLKKPLKWKPLRKRLTALKIDIVIDPQSLTKSSMLGKMSGAPLRLGFDSPYGRELSSMCNTQFIKTQHSHLVDRTLDFLEHSSLKIEDRTVEFRLPIQMTDHETVVSWLQAQELGDFFAINPGASWESKRWLPKRFGFVARYIQQAYGLRSLVTWAGEEESAMAQEVVENSRGAAIAAPATSLGELAAFLEKSQAFIGCDTGPLHIAAATGARCIGLYGPTLPTDSGAYGEQHVAVQRWHQNDRNRKRATNLAMRDITVDDVCVAIDQMMPSEKLVASAA